MNRMAMRQDRASSVLEAEVHSTARLMPANNASFNPLMTRTI